MPPARPPPRKRAAPPHGGTPAPPAAAADDAGTNLAALSIHGASAAKRQAATELLFFASVGDLDRCRAVAAGWGLDVDGSDYDKRTPL
jgi:hypothetical protein